MLAGRRGRGGALGRLGARRGRVDVGQHFAQHRRIRVGVELLVLPGASLGTPRRGGLALLVVDGPQEGRRGARERVPLVVVVVVVVVVLLLLLGWLLLLVLGLGPERRVRWGPADAAVDAASGVQ